MCDVVYHLLLEQVELSARDDRRDLVTFIAAGAKDVKIPTVEEARAEFEHLLHAEPEPVTAVDGDQLALRRILGVAS